MLGDLRAAVDAAAEAVASLQAAPGSVAALSAVDQAAAAAAVLEQDLTAEVLQRLVSTWNTATGPGWRTHRHWRRVAERWGSPCCWILVGCAR
jgi:hypothetical protein